MWTDYPSGRLGVRCRSEAVAGGISFLGFTPTLTGLGDWTAFMVVRKLGPFEAGPSLRGGVAGSFSAVQTHLGTTEAHAGASVVSAADPNGLGTIWRGGSARQGSTWSIYRDGVSLASSPLVGTATSITSVLGINPPVGSGYWWLGEVIVYDRFLATPERDTVFAYLASRFPV